MLRACDGLLPLPVKEKAFPGLPQALPKCPRASEASKSSETYQNRCVFPWTSASLQNRISQALAMDSAYTCNGWLSGHARDELFPLPVEQKAISKLLGDARDRLSPCLSRKRPSQVPPRRCRSALGLPRLWKFPSLSTSFCFPSDFGELPKSDNPGFRNRIIRVLAMDFARACDGQLSRNARNGI